MIINADGKRFVDEGAEFRNYTYAKYGREILNQPRQFAYQVFDQKTVHLLRDEYRIREVTKAQSDKLAKTLKAQVGKAVTINATVDESIIGGLIVKVGSKMIDTSIKSKLSALQNTMKEVG